jgi:hypothetical protein
MMAIEREREEEASLSSGLRSYLTKSNVVISNGHERNVQLMTNNMRTFESELSIPDFAIRGGETTRHTLGLTRVETVKTCVYRFANNSCLIVMNDSRATMTF